MKNLILFFILLLGYFSFAQNDVWVNDYVKADGTYIEGHYKTHANGTAKDNYSTIGNTNPHTGEDGTIYVSDPDNTVYYSYSPPVYEPSNWEDISRSVLRDMEERRTENDIATGSSEFKPGYVPPSVEYDEGYFYKAPLAQEVKPTFESKSYEPPVIHEEPFDYSGIKTTASDFIFSALIIFGILLFLLSVKTYRR